MTTEVGFIKNFPTFREGEKGIFYDYLLAGNGIFIEAENPILSLRLPVAECELRGLAPSKFKISMTYGSIPSSLFDQAISAFMEDTTKEYYVAITAAAGYQLYIPPQDKKECKVVYNVADSVILDIHSHANMPAGFSQKDDDDELGLKLYAVVGGLASKPVVKLRAGAYGYFWPISWSDVFCGTLNGAIELEEMEIEVNELQNQEPGVCETVTTSHNWMRWYRKFFGRGIMPAVH